jgi:hypothetical protein
VQKGGPFILLGRRTGDHIVTAVSLSSWSLHIPDDLENRRSLAHVLTQAGRYGASLIPTSVKWLCVGDLALRRSAERQRRMEMCRDCQHIFMSCSQEALGRGCSAEPEDEVPSPLD